MYTTVAAKIEGLIIKAISYSVASAISNHKCCVPCHMLRHLQLCLSKTWRDELLKLCVKILETVSRLFL